MANINAKSALKQEEQVAFIMTGLIKDINSMKKILPEMIPHLDMLKCLLIDYLTLDIISDAMAERDCPADCLQDEDYFGTDDLCN